MKADIELVKESQVGDIEAVGHLYDRYHQDIYRYVLTRVRDQQLAEDLTGEVFTRMVQHLPKYRDLSQPFRAWLYRIASNLMVDHFRRQNKQDSRWYGFIKQSRVTVGENPALIIEQKLTMEEIFEALERIDDVQRDVVILRFLMGLPLADVAHSLDRSVASVKSLQHRGLKSLRVALNSPNLQVS